MPFLRTLCYKKPTQEVTTIPAAVHPFAECYQSCSATPPWLKPTDQCYIHPGPGTQSSSADYGTGAVLLLSPFPAK